MSLDEIDIRHHSHSLHHCRTLLKTPNVSVKPAQTLFHFHKPRERLPILKPRSSLLDFTELQHDYMYALAGCSDVSFVQSKVADDVRETLHNIFGMEKVKIGLWFKNRRPKDSPSTRTTGGARLTIVSAQRTGSNLTEDGDVPFFMEEHLYQNRGKRPSSSRSISTPEFGAPLPNFAQQAHPLMVDMSSFHRPQSSSALMMNPNLFLQQQQQIQALHSEQFMRQTQDQHQMQQLSSSMFPGSQALTIEAHQGSQAAAATAQLNSAAAQLSTASAHLASMIQSSQHQQSRQHQQDSGGGASSTVCSLADLLSQINLFTTQGSPSSVMEALILARRRGLNRISPATPIDFLTDLLVAAASAGATASLGQGPLGGMDFNALQSLNVSSAPLEALKAQVQEEYNRQRLAAAISGMGGIQMPNNSLNGSGSGLGFNLGFPQANKPTSDGNAGFNLGFPQANKPTSDGNAGFNLGFPQANKPTSDGNASLNLGFPQANKPTSDGNAGFNLGFAPLPKSMSDATTSASTLAMHGLGLDRGLFPAPHTQSDGSARPLGQAPVPMSAPNLLFSESGTYQSIAAPPMGQFQVLNLAQTNNNNQQQLPVNNFQSMPQLSSSNVNNAQQVSQYLQTQLQQMQHQNH